MPTLQKNILTKASTTQLGNEEVGISKKTDWDEIAKKVGIIASIITAVGFLISILVLVVSIYTHLMDFSNKQTDLNIQLTSRISQLEGKLDAITKSK